MVLSPPYLIADLDWCDIFACILQSCYTGTGPVKQLWRIHIIADGYQSTKNATNMSTSRDVYHAYYVLDLQRFLEVRLIMFWPQIFITGL